MSARDSAARAYLVVGTYALSIFVVGAFTTVVSYESETISSAMQTLDGSARSGMMVRRFGETAG